MNTTMLAEGPQWKSTSRFVVVMIMLCVLLAWGLVMNVNIGSAKIPTGEVFRLTWDALRYKAMDTVTGNYGAELEQAVSGTTASRIIFTMRMPRMLLAAVLGGALALSGFLLQTFFRNPISGPFVLGIASGAKMIVGITIIFMSGIVNTGNSSSLVISAFGGSLLIMGLVLAFSKRSHNMSMLLVLGIMVGYICSAVTDFCVTFADERDIAELTNWSMGTFSNADWDKVGTASILCFACLLGSWLLSKPIGAYALGEGYAQSMGLNIKLFRTMLILLSSLLSACVTAFAGPISFVGIAVPHVTRSLLKTSRPILVIPAVFVCGAVFCVFCDLIARTAFAPTEMAIGTVTAVFGAPVVIYMILKRQRAQEV